MPAKPTPKSAVQIPSPKMVAEWDALSKERCDQMLAMTQRELDRNNRYAFCGMLSALLVFLVLTGSAVYMGYIGNIKAVWAFLTTTMVGLVTSFLGARR
jgi:hypothetical protein